jgi:hypothetical protein
MNKIEYFQGRPFDKSRKKFLKPQSGARTWLMGETNDQYRFINLYFINGKEVGAEDGVTHPTELRPKAFELGAEDFEHHCLLQHENWQLLNVYTWKHRIDSRYVLWLKCSAFIEDDALAIQFKLSEPWERDYEQD